MSQDDKILRITMKTTDTLSRSLDEICVKDGDTYRHLTDDEQNEWFTICKRWFRYGEIVVLEVNITQQTIQVVPIC